MKKLLAPAAVCLFLLTGCASGGDTPKSPGATQAAAETATPTPTPTPTAEATTIETVTAKLGITDFNQSPTVAPGATKWGTGTYEGSKAQVYEFAGDAEYKVFLDSVASYGIVEAQLIRVGNIVVSITDQTKTDQARAALA